MSEQEEREISDGEVRQVCRAFAFRWREELVEALKDDSKTAQALYWIGYALCELAGASVPTRENGLISEDLRHGALMDRLRRIGSERHLDTDRRQGVDLGHGDGN